MHGMTVGGETIHAVCSGQTSRRDEGTKQRVKAVSQN